MAHKNLAADRVLWVGDAAAYVLVTLLGFSTHGTLDTQSSGRILVTLLPFYAAWLLFATWGGVMQVDSPRPISWVFRSGITAVLASPFASLLRGLWLKAPVLPVFVLVMAGVSGFAIMVWRSIYHYWIHPRIPH